MKCSQRAILVISYGFLLLVSNAIGETNQAYPHPVNNPDSKLMLNLVGSGTDPTKIDFSNLPELKGDHAVISRGDKEWHFRLHNYLVHFGGQYWCMWSHGPKVEDRPSQHVCYATSKDGLHWSEPRVLVPPSEEEGFRHIARGFWVRGDGKLRALASHDEALKDGYVHYFGKSLELRCYLWSPDKRNWEYKGVVFDNTINNFPPKKLVPDKWMMTRRTADRSVSFLIGGRASIDTWEVVPLSTLKRKESGKLDEPYWYYLLDGNLAALFRDNSRSRRLLRAFSVDNGSTWSNPVRTNFPDATSKFNVTRTSGGLYILVSNANPRGRNPLCVAVSRDGLVYNGMARLPIPQTIDSVEWEEDSQYFSTRYESFQYPHAIEHEGYILVAFSRKKQTVEIVRFALAEIERRLPSKL